MSLLEQAHDLNITSIEQARNRNTTSLQQEHDLNIATVESVDFSALENLYTHSVRCHPGGFVQDLSYHGPIQSICLDYVNNGGDMLTAKIGGVLVGMGGLRKVSSGRAELCNLHIYPTYQGYGYGKCLAQKLLTRAGELAFQKIELHVTKTQHIAILLYQRLGFIETKEAIYKTEIDGKKYTFNTIHMEKIL